MKICPSPGWGYMFAALRCAFTRLRCWAENNSVSWDALDVHFRRLQKVVVTPFLVGSDLPVEPLTWYMWNTSPISLQIKGIQIHSSCRIIQTEAAFKSFFEGVCIQECSICETRRPTGSLTHQLSVPWAAGTTIRISHSLGVHALTLVAS